jgi:hypothetical protein
LVFKKERGLYKMLRIIKVAMLEQKCVEFVVSGALTYQDLLEMKAEIDNNPNVQFIFNLREMTAQEDGDSIQSFLAGIVKPLIEKNKLFCKPLWPEKINSLILLLL